MKIPYISVKKHWTCKKCGKKEWELIYVDLKLKQVVIVCSNCGEEIKEYKIEWRKDLIIP